MIEFKIADIDFNEEKSEKTHVPKHKGLFYRVKESMYYSHSSGVFHKKLTLTPLKRISCKGCPTCDYIYEMISEYDAEELIDGKWKNNSIVELKVEGGKDWTDCGWEYDSWLEWEEVKND